MGSGPPCSLNRHPERPGSVSQGEVRAASCAWDLGEFVATSARGGGRPGTAGCHGHGGGGWSAHARGGAPARNFGGVL